MIRIEVSEGIWVVDYEAGIGREGYVPPNPRWQRPREIVDIEQSHREVEQPEGWKITGQTAVAAAIQEQATM